MKRPKRVTRMRDKKLADKLRQVVGDIDDLCDDELVSHERTDPGERRAWKAVAASLRVLIAEIGA